MLLLLGCKAAPPQQPAPAQALPQPSALDPCPEQLHEICGALLRFYLASKRLPFDLEEMASPGEAHAPAAMTCPVSRKFYVYNRSGLSLPGQPGLVILYDPEPSHGAYRWAISVEDPQEGPLITRVIAIPETKFALLARPAPAPEPLPELVPEAEDDQQ